MTASERQNERLVALFYLLIRDQLPAGTVIKIVNDLSCDDDFKFTNKDLESLSRDLIVRLSK